MAAVGATYSYNNGTQGGTATNWTRNVTTYATMSVTASTTAGASGNAILTLSADVTSTRCIISFAGPGQSSAADAYSMRGAAAGVITQVFVLPTGVAQGGSLSYTLYFKSSTSGQACNINEASLVVMAP